MKSRLTPEDKLKALKKAWGYVEVVQATIQVSGWKIWLVKNYSGKPIAQIDGQGLPGNPKAKRKIEFSGNTARDAANRAYELTI